MKAPHNWGVFMCATACSNELQVLTESSLVLTLAVLAQVGSVFGHFQLKLAVGWDGELATADERLPAVAAWQLNCQRTGYHVHHFQLAGAELIFTSSHNADGGRAVGHGEGNGFNGAVEVFVNFKHG